MEKAVVLCSGGLNSAVLTALAREEHEIAMLHARVSHRAAKREAELFNALADHFAPKLRLVVDMPHLAALSAGPRFDAKLAMPPFNAAREALAASAIPGLIGTLLQAACAWAGTIGASRVFVGTCENLGAPGPRTATVWPEHSREYVFLSNQPLSVSGSDALVAIEAPLIDLSRTEIIQMGKRLGVPFDRTWSCLASGDQPCGRCLGCATRARGFLDAAIVDPLLALNEVAMA